MNNSFTEKPYKGSKGILLGRCSTPQQAEYSVSQQIVHMRSFSEQSGFTVHDEMKLEGVTGLDPDARWDIDEIVKRKRNGEDFDLVVVASVDRLTRGGAQHGFWIKQEFENCGLELISARDDLPKGRRDWVILGMKLEEAYAEVEGITHRFVRGLTASIQDGRNVHAQHPPFGLDRLYVTPEGKPLHRIRNLADGTQVMLKTEGEGDDAVVRSFPKIVKGKKSQHYKRQAGELVTYVPGDPARVATVKTLFYDFYIKGRGTQRIVKELNDRGIRTANGKRWQTGTLDKILGNTTYMGLGIGNRQTSAVLFMRGAKDCIPLKPIKRDKRAQKGNTKRTKASEERRQKKHRPLLFRDVQDHLPVRYPHLSQMLDNLTPEQRNEIRRHQRAEYERKAEGLPSPKLRKRGGDSHPQSSYILKGLLVCKQDKAPMVGKPTGPLRYYARTKAIRVPASDTPYSAVRADLLEQQVLCAVEEVLNEFPNLEGCVREVALRAVAQPEKEDAHHLKRLRTVIHDLSEEIKSITLGLSKLGPTIIAQVTEGKQQELLTAKRSLDRAESVVGNSHVDIELVMDSVIRDLRDLRSLVNKNSINPELRRLLASIVLRLEYDLDTRCVELELGIAGAHLSGIIGRCNDQRLVKTNHTRDFHQTLHQNSIFLGYFEGKYIKPFSRKLPPSLTLSRIFDPATHPPAKFLSRNLPRLKKHKANGSSTSMSGRPKSKVRC